MKYDIKYPYFGRTFGGLYFVITAPEYAIVLQHHGTQGFGFSAFISREKVLKLFKFSKEITKEDFQKAIQKQALNFFPKIPGSNMVLNTTKEIELIERKHNDTFNEQNKTNY